MAYVFLRGVGPGGGGGGGGVPARIAPGCGLGGGVLCALGELLGEEGGGDGGQGGDPALDVVAVEIGAIVCAWKGSGERGTRGGRRTLVGGGGQGDRAGETGEGHGSV